MKILIVTQKIDKNDGYFGFFHDWLIEFAKRCERVTAIGLEVGAYDLPGNVKVYSLGKEAGRSRLKYAYRLLAYSWRERKDYDAVFVHMNPPYLIVGGWLWRLLGKKIGFWYLHRNVDLKLRIAAVLADDIFSAAPESFRLKSKKIHFMGQAVPLPRYARPAGFKRSSGEPFTIVSVGRITPIKNLDTLIEAASILRGRGVAVRVDLVGEPVTPADQEYKEGLVELIDKKSLGPTMNFVGSVPNKDIPSWYWKSDLSVNLCPTGGLDKAVLESMAAGTPVMASNEAFREYFGGYGGRMMFKERDPADLVAKLEAFMRAGDKAAIASKLLAEAQKRSSLSALVGKIVEILGK
ncbi:MAG: glycosyltransferase family 4 protein [Minisyncoccia bacterium]|jgi:glycosyltransferase involved in cell wall biosynthesis